MIGLLNVEQIGYGREVEVKFQSAGRMIGLLNARALPRRGAPFIVSIRRADDWAFEPENTEPTISAAAGFNPPGG